MRLLFSAVLTGESGRRWLPVRARAACDDGSVVGFPPFLLALAVIGVALPLPVIGRAVASLRGDVMSSALAAVFDSG
jgi:hypothetical protein